MVIVAELTGNDTGVAEPASVRLDPAGRSVLGLERGGFNDFAFLVADGDVAMRQHLGLLCCLGISGAPVSFER
jgi:hypothetical protein